MSMSSSSVVAIQYLRLVTLSFSKLQSTQWALSKAFAETNILKKQALKNEVYKFIYHTEERKYGGKLCPSNLHFVQT